MEYEPQGRVAAAPEIRVELVGAGPPGETPYVGINGNWWIGRTDTGTSATGEPAAEHSQLRGRDQEDQHPIRAVTGLREALEHIPPAVEPITNTEMEEMLK